MIGTVDSTLLSVASGFLGGIVASVVGQLLALTRQRRTDIVQLKSPLVEAKHISAEELVIIKRQYDPAFLPDLQEQAMIDDFHQVQSRLKTARAEAAYLLDGEQLKLIQKVDSLFNVVIDESRKSPSPADLETMFEEHSKDAIDSLPRL
ncbi:hypothetical protein ACOZ4B_01575 (plasmid) [Haloferax prahovense]|uniref:hypothetical protein n=1 Tax=Haloferax prahovense TaxID=381852 RepID=UPI003C7325D4